MTRLTHVTRRLVETGAGPMVVLLKPGKNGRPAVVEVRRKHGKKALCSLTVTDPRAALPQLSMFKEDENAREAAQPEAATPDRPV